MTKREFTESLNKMGASGVPFLFIIDFELEKPIVISLSDLDPSEILFEIDGVSNFQKPAHLNPLNDSFEKTPIAFELYKKKFELVFDRLNYGDSYLTNLTVKTKIDLSNSLTELFFLSKARYKLLYKNEFLVFSPECFIQIKDNYIFSYPMKGTIDAAVPHAAQKILNDQKELAEHVTIVDLIRNDLSQVATKVDVTKFRYLEEIKTNSKTLLQVSSEIRGLLPKDYRGHLGDILVALLPAGSVSGAPKPKTLDIIRQAEAESRGYYTGVFGYFDGRELNSGVMIRFVEKMGDVFYYRSGGGITTQSLVQNEYQEVIDKVYVPLD